MMQETLNKQIIITTISLIAVILLFNFTNLDMTIQHYFYDFETKNWILSEKEPIANLIFYSGFKKLFISFSIILLIVLLFINKISILKEYKKGLIILLLSMIFVSSLAILKNITNMPCPFNTIEFGGKYPEVKLFESYPQDNTPPKILKCYPAGHATMGFSLMALYFLFKTQKNKNLGLIIGITTGILTGGYKMLIGDHFLSHTLVTMILAWLIILLIVKFISYIQRQKFEKPTKV